MRIKMKKTIINILLILTTFIIYFLQSNFFSWFTISGVMPNLFVIYVLFIGLFSNRLTGVIYGVVIGAILDLVIGTKVGIYSFGLAVIGFLAATFDKNFSKDSRATIMFMVLGATLTFEIGIYILNYFVLGINVELINFIRILAIEIIYNLIIVIILYPLIQKCGYDMEHEYKGNRILTRYF